MRIIYGVSGEGSGHSSRAREMATHLLEQGHEVKLVSYDRGYRNLKDDFDVVEIEGLCIASADNKVSIVKTFTANLGRLSEGHRKLQQLRQLFKRFQPGCVITDFEPMTAYLGRHYEVPLVSIDNQHRMRYMRCDLPAEMLMDLRVTRTIIRAMVPSPDVSLVTTFHFGPVRNERTFLFPPILRREVLQRKPSDGERILVYLTSGYESLLERLKAFQRESFLVYGYDRQDADGPLSYRRPSSEGFLDDLCQCKAVIATAGFTLISEALHLRKPYLALPMEGQFEQQLNGFQLQQQGFGRNGPEPTDETVGDFLYRLPDYRQRLRNYQASDNRAIAAKLDELLGDDGQLLRQYQRMRRGINSESR